MKKVTSIIVVALTSSLFTLLVVWLTKESVPPMTEVQRPVPSGAWPEFDSKAPYTINGPLWVGFDDQAGQWRYLKLPGSEQPGEQERGLKDPGDPSSWNDQPGTSGFFNGNLDALPSGTHLNNRYDPSTKACFYHIDDYVIKVGNFWVDQYESSIVMIEVPDRFTWLDDPPYGGTDSTFKDAAGTAQHVGLNCLAVSQRRKPTSGITYFVAEQCAVNNGKHIIRNEQWQAAASGTLRSDATGMESGGQSWKTIDQQDLSRFGVVGCAGSLWEWTSSWGQYGQHYEGVPTNWYDWPGPQSYVEWDDRFDTYGNDIVINVAGRAYTRQDSARYATGLPSALVRGGSWGDHNRAGIFALIADGAPTYYGVEVGFRCAK